MKYCFQLRLFFLAAKTKFGLISVIHTLFRLTKCSCNDLLSANMRPCGINFKAKLTKKKISDIAHIATFINFEGDRNIVSGE